MPVNLTAKQAEVEASLDAMANRQRMREQRRKDTLAIYAAAVTQAVGRDNAEEFLTQKMAKVGVNDGIFLGDRGVERTPQTLSKNIHTGFVMTAEGAYFALKAVGSDGNIQIVPFEAAQLAALVEDASNALAAYHNASGSLSHHLGAKGASEYQKCLEEMARDHLNLSGVTAKIIREAKYQAELQIASFAKSAESLATEKAERKTADLVRKLSAAATLPVGLEKSMLLDEVAPMVKRAFGQGD